MYTRVPRPIALAICLLVLSGCASGIDPRHFEAGRSAYYPLAVATSAGEIAVTGKTYRLSDREFEGSDECVRGLDIGFGILGPMCPAVIAADMETARQIKKLQQEFARDVRVLMPRLEAVVDREILREHTLSYLQSHGADAQALSSSTVNDEPSLYPAELHRRGYSMLLEISVLSLDFSERELSRNDWSHCLRMQVQAQARSLPESDEIAAKKVMHTICQPYAHWLEAGAVEDAATQLYGILSARLVDEILLLHRDPKARSALVSPLEPVPPGSSDDAALRAAKPLLRRDFQACCFIPFTEIDTYPKFAWTPVSAPGAADVRYDFRIREGNIQVEKWLGGDSGYKPFSQVIVPGPVVYSRANLGSSSHRVDMELKPCRWYFWSVRTRYRLENFPRVSAWSDEKRPRNGMESPFPVRTRASDDAPECWNEAVDWGIREAVRN